MNLPYLATKNEGNCYYYCYDILKQKIYSNLALSPKLFYLTIISLIFQLVLMVYVVYVLDHKIEKEKVIILMFIMVSLILADGLILFLSIKFI